MTILDRVFSSKIYKSKLLHEMWAFMQTHPSLHILYKWVKCTSCDLYDFAEFRPRTFILCTDIAQHVHCPVYVHHENYFNIALDEFRDFLAIFSYVIP